MNPRPAGGRRASFGGAPRRALAGATLVAGLAACASCIYTAESSLPAHIRTVRIEMFDNRSGYPGMDALVVEELARAFHVDGTLRAVSRNADAVLSGAVVAVRRSVVQEDSLDDVVTGRVVVTASVTFVDVSSDTRLLDRASVLSTDTRGDAGLFRLRRGETEAAARDAAAAELARSIVRRVVEVW
jgi:hypothetical protein